MKRIQMLFEKYLYEAASKRSYTPKDTFDPILNPTGQKIIDLYINWYHPGEIAEELGIEVSEVENFLRDNRKSGRASVLTPEKLEMVKQMYNDGMHINRIANELGIAHMTVRAAIQKLDLKKDIPVYSSTQPHNHDLHLANKRIQFIDFLIKTGKLKKYYDKGYTFPKLASVLKLTPPELRKALQDARLEMPEN